MKKIIIFIAIYLYILTGHTFAKYTINYELDCFEFIIKKDLEAPSFQIIYSTKDWTNLDVRIEVVASEPVQGIDGFVYKDGKYERIVKQNETKEISVMDLAGNEALLKYEVTNIDKNPPYIIGIENNGRYSEIKTAKYFDDESNIKTIEKIFYGDLLIDSHKEDQITNNYNNDIIINILRAPKNVVNYKYFRIENGQENYICSSKKSLKFNNLNNNSCNYFVIAEDSNGNNYKSNIIDNSNNSLEQYHAQEDNNTFSKNGIYDINITDYAGNKCSYTIFLDL